MNLSVELLNNNIRVFGLKFSSEEVIGFVIDDDILVNTDFDIETIKYHIQLFSKHILTGYGDCIKLWDAEEHSILTKDIRDIEDPDDARATLRTEIAKLQPIFGKACA